MAPWTEVFTSCSSFYKLLLDASACRITSARLIASLSLNLSPSCQRFRVSRSRPMRLASGLERPVVSNPSRRISSRSSRVKVSTWPARSPCCSWPLVCARSPCCARSVTGDLASLIANPPFVGRAVDLPGHPEVPAAQSGPAVARGGCQRSRRPARQEINQSGGFARGELQEDGSEWLGYAWVLCGYGFVVSPCRVSASGALGSA